MYSPYVVLNRTGLELDIRTKAFLAQARAAAGQGLVREDGSDATPVMFSFSNDDQRNRALFKLGDSSWSKPQSLNAIGSAYSVSVPSSTARSSMQIGVSVAQGEGKVKNLLELNVIMLINAVQPDERCHGCTALHYQEQARRRH